MWVQQVPALGRAHQRGGLRHLWVFSISKWVEIMSTPSKNQVGVHVFCSASDRDRILEVPVAPTHCCTSFRQSSLKWQTLSLLEKASPRGANRSSEPHLRGCPCWVWSSEEVFLFLSTCLTKDPLILTPLLRNQVWKQPRDRNSWHINALAGTKALAGTSP